MRLYSPVDLTGNMNMIEKLVLGGTGTGDPQPDALTSAPSSHAIYIYPRYDHLQVLSRALALDPAPTMSQRLICGRCIKVI